MAKPYVRPTFNLYYLMLLVVGGAIGKGIGSTIAARATKVFPLLGVSRHSGFGMGLVGASLVSKN